MTQRPAPIRTDSSNAFAHRTIRQRLPAIIRETQSLNPDYADSIQRALADLHAALVNDASVPMLTLPAPDYDDWDAAYADHTGETWQATEWFFGETYFYRLLIQATRWWETGRDPFAPKKAEEYAGDALWELLSRALAIAGGREAQLSALLAYALWGNRIDLSYALAASHGSDIQDDDLLVDERDAVIDFVLRGRGIVHIIADNAGTELALDLALADWLLREAVADQVIVHLKLHPTFVSDATALDAMGFIERLESGERGDLPRHFGQRLRAMLEQGRLRLAPDAYWNGSRFLWDLPPRLSQMFQRGWLTIIKGDANYRRMVGDAVWPPETALEAVIGAFPCPLLALRTLKSDPIVGLPAGLAQKLDTIDADWRVNGRRGVLQTMLKESGR